MREGLRKEVEGANGFSLPDDMADPLKRLLQYWREMPRDGGGAPRKKRFDPLDLHHLWHGLNVLQFTDPGGDLNQTRIRYAGEQVDRMHGRSLVGKSLREVLDDTEYRRSMPHLIQALQERTPHFRRGMWPNPQKGPVPYERLFVPFADDSDRPAWLIGVWRWMPHHLSSVTTLHDGVHRVTSRAAVD